MRILHQMQMRQEPKQRNHLRIASTGRNLAEAWPPTEQSYGGKNVSGLLPDITTTRRMSRHKLKEPGMSTFECSARIRVSVAVHES